jgi:hypothetical protein
MNFCVFHDKVTFVQSTYVLIAPYPPRAAIKESNVQSICQLSYECIEQNDPHQYPVARKHSSQKTLTDKTVQDSSGWSKKPAP